MKKNLLITVLFVLLTSVLAAKDLIILRDGNVIEAKILEISPTEIKYKRFDHLDGPTIIVPAKDVLSMRYENGTVEVVNAASAPTAEGTASGQTSPGGNLDPSLGVPTLLQTILNTLPAVTVAGNSLKFQFGGDAWMARLNGQNFSKGVIDFTETAEGGTLTLHQTHIYPGAVGETAGKIAGLIPGGGRVGSALNAAGDAAGVLGPIEAAGTIVLAYRAGPPASLSLVSNSDDAGENSGNVESRTNNFVAGGPSEESRANIRENWIMGELGVAGLGVRYERMLGRKISLALHPYFNLMRFAIYNEDYGIDLVFRWYPWGREFFMGTGFGYHRLNHAGYDNAKIETSLGPTYTSSSYRYDLNGMGIPLELGWKIDPGRPGTFYVEIGLAGAFIFGKKIYTDLPDDLGVDTDEWEIRGSGRIYFGMGVSF